jgi:hypothetical protein
MLVFWRVVAGIWPWELPRISKIDIINGVAPTLLPLEWEEPEWRKVITRILNAI